MYVKFRKNQKYINEQNCSNRWLFLFWIGAHSKLSKTYKIVSGQLRKIAALPDPKFWKRPNIFFKTAKGVERFGKKCQNNPSGNSHILLNNTQTIQIKELWSKILFLDKTEKPRQYKTLLHYWIETLTQCMIFLWTKKKE